MGVRFPVDREALLAHVSRNGAPVEQVDVIRALPERTYASREDVARAIGALPEQGRVRGTVRALMAAGMGAAAVRTLVKQVAKRSLGPVGLVITAGEALLAVRAATKALARWRADRRLRRAMTK